MMLKKLFLRWVLFVSTIGATTIIAANLNTFQYIYESDVTKLSFVILSIFIVMTLFCGVLTWRASNLIDGLRKPLSLKKGLLGKIENQSNHGWFSVGLCEKIGLTGTVCGFILMLAGGFGDYQSDNQEAISQLLGQLSAGMATAFITTLVGVVCGMLLSVQYHNLTNAIERAKNEWV